METKSVFLSKEVWVIFLGVLNVVFNKIGLPSFEPTPEFYTAVLMVIGVLRVWFTKAGVHIFKKEI
mgnify:CR=1 FL=1